MEDLAGERDVLLEGFEEEYFDGNVAKIVSNNLYIVTSKDIGEKESEFEQQLKEIFGVEN
ncbi:hypothetical protein D3C86_2237850 [compost metagenome]